MSLKMLVRCHLKKISRPCDQAPRISASLLYTNSTTKGKNYYNSHTYSKTQSCHLSLSKTHKCLETPCVYFLRK